MKVIHAKSEDVLYFGRRGENLARQIVFDLSDFLSEYGDGTAELIVQRPGEMKTYPAAIVQEGATVTWTLTAADTALSSSICKNGHCELLWYVGDVLVKSKIWRTWVDNAMDTPNEETPPEPEQGWVDQVVAVGAAVKVAAAQALADLRALYQEMQTWAQGAIQNINDAGSAAVQSVQSAGDAQVQRVTEEGTRQTANAKAQADAAAQSAADAAQSAQQAAESAAVYDTVVADVTQLKSDLSILRQSTRNIFDANALNVEGITKDDDGYYSGTVKAWNTAFSSILPVDGVFDEGERYTTSCSYYYSGVVDFSNVGCSLKIHYTDGSIGNYINFITTNQTETDAKNTSTNEKSIEFISVNTSDARANNYVLHIKNLQIEKGIENTPFVEHFTAMDIIAEDRLSSAEDRLSSVENDVENYGNSVKTIEDTKVQALLGSFLGRKERFYDHIFVDKLYGNAVIPSESIFNVESARRLGFSVIEANVHKLADGNYIVMHGENGKFGRQVVHIDGETNIADTRFSSVTLEWVKENVRYASSYEKYRVAPPTLQEFVSACKYNCLIPLVQIVDTDEIEILNKILGKDNFIAYNSISLDIRNATSAFMFCWNGFDTKEKIVEWVRKFKPCSYGMSNITSFTDEELKDIVEAVHAEGCYIHTAYAKANNQERVNKLGFDFNASLYSVNEFEYGNICNLFGDVSFDDFTTDGLATNGEIILTENQIVSPGETMPNIFLGKGSLHIRFNGAIDVSMGRYINSTYGGNSFTSDGTEDLWLSTFFIEEQPTFAIAAKSDTTILSISYKASKC